MFTAISMHRLAGSKRPRRRALLGALALGLASVPWASAQVPERVDVGTVADSMTIPIQFEVRNPSLMRTIRVDAIPASDRLSVRPGTFHLRPCETRTIAVSYTAERYPWESGERVERSLLIKSDLASMDDSRIRFVATIYSSGGAMVQSASNCDACRVVEESLNEDSVVKKLSQQVVLLDIYADATHLEAVRQLERTLTERVRRHGRVLRISEIDTSTAPGRGLLERYLAENGWTLKELPAVVVRDSMFQGAKEIEDGVQSVLQGSP